MKDSALATLLGSSAAELVLLHLYHYGETYGRAISADFEISLQPVQRQLDKFERAGVLVSKLTGRTRVYSWNPKSPLAPRLKDLVKVVYDALPQTRRAEMFSTRRRPRAKGKPV